ncbi:MAG: hypothetical protein IPI41_17035 [Flavobacteriales bacterium]|nr:hypothetical protein [Flavobacteriales bacterium]
MEPSVHTSTATASRMADRVLLRRYKPHSTINAATIAENVEARRFLPGPDPEAVIVVIPENARFALSFVENAPWAVLGLDRVTHVLAWVAEGELFQRLKDLHVTDPPPGIHFQVFPHMQEAVSWVERILATHDLAWFLTARAPAGPFSDARAFPNRPC